MKKQALKFVAGYVGCVWCLLNVSMCAYVLFYRVEKRRMKKEKRREERLDEWNYRCRQFLPARLLLFCLLVPSKTCEQARVSFLMFYYRNSIWFDTILLFFRSGILNSFEDFDFKAATFCPQVRQSWALVSISMVEVTTSPTTIVFFTHSLFIHSSIQQVSPSSNSAAIVIACLFFNKNNIVRRSFFVPRTAKSTTVMMMMITP